MIKNLKQKIFLLLSFIFIFNLASAVPANCNPDLAGGQSCNGDVLNAVAPNNTYLINVNNTNNWAGHAYPSLNENSVVYWANNIFNGFGKFYLDVLSIFGTSASLDFPNSCIDEIEQIGSKEKQTLRELLNSAYKKGTKVKRMRKMKIQGQEQQVTECFEPYFPICMANIRGVEEVLGDRSIVIVLEKSCHQGITKKIEDFEENDKIKAIKFALTKLVTCCEVTWREKTYTKEWNNYINSKYITTSHTSYTPQHTTTNHSIELEELFNRIDNLGIVGRNFELLYPLLLTAKQISDEAFEDMLIIGTELTAQKKEDEYVESKDVSMFEFVVSMDSFQQEPILVKELTQRFREWMGEQEQDDKWLNDRWVGLALKRLNLVLFKKKTNRGSNVILNFAKAREKLKIFKMEDKISVKVLVVIP